MALIDQSRVRARCRIVSVTRHGMKSVGSVGFLCLVMLVTGAGAATAQSVVMPEDSSPVAGKALYSEYCASCHGANLEGQPDWQSPAADGVFPAPPHDRTGHTWHHGDGLLFEYVSLGGAAALEKRGITGFASAMPGFAKVLSADEIWDIMAYIKSEWPEQIQAMQQERTASEVKEGN